MPGIPIDSSPAFNRAGRVVLWTAASWAVLAIAGVVAISRPDALGASHPVSFTRAVFTSVNAATASGFTQQFAKPSDFSPFVQWVISFEALGGILLSLIAGGIVLSTVLRLDLAHGKIAGTAALLIGIAAVAGVMSRSTDSFSESMDRGIRALGGAGPAQQLIGWTPLSEKLVLTPLALLGSLGVLPVVLFLQRAPSPAAFRRHFRGVLLVAAAVYLAGFAVNGLQYLIVHAPLRSAIEAASAVTLAARGWGMAVDFASAWPRGVAWSAMAVSLVGVGTLGAMPSLGLAWLLTFPRSIGSTILKLLAVQAGVSLLTLLILLQTEPQLSAERIVMLVVSAATKTGLSHEAVSITGPGLLALAALIVVSKILPLGLLLAARCDTQPVDDA